MTEPTLETVTFTTRRSLLTLVRQEGAQVRLFVPSDTTRYAGEAARVRVAFGDSVKSFFIHGKVTSAQRADAQRPGGFDLTIETPDEFRAWSHLFAYCSRNQAPARRYPTAIRCSVNTGQAKVEGLIRDLSMTGAFVVMSGHGAMPLGSTVTIELGGGLFGLGKTQLKAQVVWQGRKDNIGGIGAIFTSGVQPVIELMKKQGVGDRA